MSVLGVQRSYKPANLPVIKLLLLVLKESDSCGFCNKGKEKNKQISEAFTNSLLFCTCGFSDAALNLLCAVRGCKEFEL